VLVKGFVDEVVEDFSAIRPHDGLNMMAYEKIGEISVAKILRDFVCDEVLPGTDIGSAISEPPEVARSFTELSLGPLGERLDTVFGWAVGLPS
jgi:hypothetical protein